MIELFACFVQILAKSCDYVRHSKQRKYDGEVDIMSVMMFYWS